MKILIQNGRVMDPASGFDAVADVAIAAGRVLSIGEVPHDFAAAHTINAAGCLVIPGLVDLAARLREPGLEHKATLESELDAAVAGGVTSLACPPDTDPPLDEPGLVDMLRRRAKVLAMLRDNPGIRYAIEVIDANTDPVIASVGIRNVATFEMTVPQAYYDAFALLELIEKHAADEHANA